MIFFFPFLFFCCCSFAISLMIFFLRCVCSFRCNSNNTLNAMCVFCVPSPTFFKNGREKAIWYFGYRWWWRCFCHRHRCVFDIDIVVVVVVITSHGIMNEWMKKSEWALGQKITVSPHENVELMLTSKKSKLYPERGAVKKKEWLGKTETFQSGIQSELNWGRACAVHWTKIVKPGNTNLHKIEVTEMVYFIHIFFVRPFFVVVRCV